MAGRLYVVEDGETMSVVRAVSPGRALNHVVKAQYNVRVATPDDIALYMGEGGQIEDATLADNDVVKANPLDQGE